MEQFSSPNTSNNRSAIQRERGYNNVTDELRLQLIELMKEEQITCRAAAQRLRIPYNTAKVINRVYRKEGRINAVPKHLKRMYAKYKKNPDML